MEYGPGSRGSLIKASTITKPVKSTDVSRGVAGCLGWLLILAIALGIAAAPVVIGMLH